MLEIAIAGAGIAGLAAAILLRRNGHKVVVYDQLETPSPVGSGFLLQPTGRAVLAALGINDEALKLGARIDRLFGVSTASGRTALDVRYGQSGRPDGYAHTNFGLGIHRAALFSLLYQKAISEGVDFEYDKHVKKILPCAGGKNRLAFKNGAQSPSADLVIDALGVSSTLAPGEPTYLAYGALWTNIPFKDEFALRPNFIEQRYFKSSQAVGVMPIGRMPGEHQNEAALFWNLKQSAHKDWRANGLERWKEEILLLWPELAPPLEQISAPEQIVMARYAHKTLRQPFEIGLVHIGDAYHSASPQIGQGANMALLDAYALSMAMDGCTDLHDALKTYKRLRHFHVRLYQAISRAFTPVYQSDSSLLPLVRDYLAAPLAHMPLINSLFSAMLAGALGSPLQKLGLIQQSTSP